MDYPFYIRPICEIPLDLIEQILEVSKKKTYGEHPHFAPEQPVTAVFGKTDFSDEIGWVARKLLDYIPLPKTAVSTWEVNLLKAGDTIYEHSDVTSQDGIQGSKVAKSHKIHIPLQTSSDVWFGHRRTRATPRKYQNMPVGFAYAYNNYVWHSVENRSTTLDRFQITMRYTDHAWHLRKKIMEICKIPHEQHYEAIEP